MPRAGVFSQSAGGALQQDGVNNQVTLYYYYLPLFISDNFTESSALFLHTLFTLTQLHKFTPVGGEWPCAWAPRCWLKEGQLLFSLPLECYRLLQFINQLTYDHPLIIR